MLDSNHSVHACVFGDVLWPVMCDMGKAVSVDVNNDVRSDELQAFDWPLEETVNLPINFANLSKFLNQI